MSPPLAARVLASVRGRPAGDSRGKLRPLTALLRLAAFVLLAAVVAIVLYVRQQRVRALEHDRAALLQAMRNQGSALTRSDRELPGKVTAAVAMHAVPAYAGDWLPDELRNERRLTELLALPTLYLRGPLDVLSRAGGVAQAALGSWRDAFVLCLLDPPPARSESALKAKARAALARGSEMQAAAHFERLEPLLQALPLLGPDWQQRVKAAETPRALDGYRKLFEVAPIQAAVRAAKARQLLLVVDEPGDTKAPAELDGERPHAVRVIVTDLASDQLQLRFRHDVDPTWLSQAARAEYASGIDSCALALDLRAALGR